MDFSPMLQQTLSDFAGMNEEHFKLSEGYWLEKTYRKGEFFNEYKNVCKHLGFIINGVFRTYHTNEETGEEKNIFFSSDRQMIVAYKSFVDQAPCNYFTEAMTPASILYLHIDHLRELYARSHQWERFGRLVAERAFSLVMTKAEALMFRTPEERYVEMMEQHPDIFNQVPLYHIASYLGIQGPSLSRIRKRMMTR
ncbi:MAG: Crp/Fnr family transcriptional regulator [Sphingobacteriales bacterium]|nr:MAG: Crp/Fnr family transcriptional regulator [Sphingobacteriales bacterium]